MDILSSPIQEEHLSPEVLHREIDYYYSHMLEIQLHALYIFYIRALIFYLKQEKDISKHPKIFTKKELKTLYHYQPKDEETYSSFIEQLEKLNIFFNKLLEDAEEIY